MLISSALNTIYEKVQGLSQKKYWYLYLGLAFIVIIFINGVGIIPEEPYQRLSQNPFTTRTDIHFNNYWQETLLLPVVAYYLDLTGTITFNALTFTLILGAYSLFALLTYRRLGSTMSLIASILLITSPLSTILLSWLGSPDGMTVLLTVPFLFAQSGLLMLFLATFGAVNHPAFIIAALEILLLRWAARDKVSAQHYILAILGSIAGYGTVQFFLNVNSIEVVSRFDFMQIRTLSEWIKLNLQVLPITFFSLFNIHWLALTVCMIIFFKKDRRFFFFVLATLLLNYGLVLFTLDTTRVFILTSWSVFFICLFHAYKLETECGEDQQNQYMQGLILIGIISLFAPRFFSWAGEIHTTPFFNIINLLLQ